MDYVLSLLSGYYNRENEMYIFPKRNVQFLPFFRGLLAEYSNGI